MDDKVQVCCTKCKSNFREKARKIQSGYSKQCPRCEVIIFFEEETFDKNIQQAMRDAKNLRRALRAEEEEQTVRRAALRAKQIEESSGDQSDEGVRSVQTPRNHSYLRR